MTSLIFSISNFYMYGLLSKLFGNNSKSSLSYKKLTGVNFSLPEKDRYSYKALLSGIKKVYGIPVLQRSKIIAPDMNTALVYDLSDTSETERLEFLKFYGVKENLKFTSSQKFEYFSSSISKLCFLILTLPIQLQLMMFGIFKKDKSGLSRILLNVLITQNLVKKVRDEKTDKVFMFSIYDTNSAFLSYSLMKRGIWVSQVASEVPLYKWNKIIVTNELILCSEYQKYELNEFKETIKFECYRLFGPELYYKAANLYVSDPVKNNKIGFYSTGGWIRNKLGHIHQGVDMESFEEKILKDINFILKNRSEIELVVYPHPREWAYFNNSEINMKDFYSKFLMDINFKISEKGKITNTVFDEVYLAICYMTTVIFERVHAGRKSAIIYFKENNFPVKYDLKNMMVINNESELRNLILSCYGEI